MKKRGYIILVSVLLCGVLLGIGNVFYARYNDSKFEKHIVEKYGFEISYPKTYKSIVSDSKNEITNNVTIQESGEIISEYMQNLNLVEVVRELKNEKNGIRFIIEAINIEKTDLTLEEICKRYVVMFKIYNEDKIIKESKNEKIIIDGKEVGKVTIKVKGENEDSIVVAYLMSLDDKEITVTFIGGESKILQNESEISKIINSLKVRTGDVH